MNKTLKLNIYHRFFFIIVVASFAKIYTTLRIITSLIKEMNMKKKKIFMMIG
jgi:hypothetical protein